MRIALLASASSIHTLRWANGLVARGVEVHLITVHALTHDVDSRVIVHVLPSMAPSGYLLSVMALRMLLKKIRPDILNAHYATGYGLLARLSGFEPLLVSVWGTDVYTFPIKSFLHRWLLRGNLRAGTAVASTSHCMAMAVRKVFEPRCMFITPFGINESIFTPRRRADKQPIIIGTVKSLAFSYGIDVLIEAFSLVRSELRGQFEVRLEITGDGPDRPRLEALARTMGVAAETTFYGSVPHSDVPEKLQRMDICAVLSRSESFGVAILEANACEVAVVVSDADGPAEVTIDGVTGFIVPREDRIATADALLKLVRSSELRRRMGVAGRMHVLASYTWDRSLDLMLAAYKGTIEIDQRNMMRN